MEATASGGAVLDISGKTQEFQKRPLSDSCGDALLPEKQAKTECSTSNENSAASGSGNHGMFATGTETSISPIEVTEAQFNHMKCKPMNNARPMTVRTDCGKVREQFYYTGLVYRYDTRDLPTLKKAGGFLPRKQRPNGKPLDIARILRQDIRLSNNSVVFFVCSAAYNDIVVATTKSISFVNDPDLQRELDNNGTKIPQKYMIDAGFLKLYGLDADATFAPCLAEPGVNFKPSYEVCFEGKIDYEAIVGYFKDNDHTKFYPNPEYKGDFRWSSLGGTVSESGGVNV